MFCLCLWLQGSEYHIQPTYRIVRLGFSKLLGCLFVCVEVLRPSQPNGIMLSAVSIPNHTGQA